MFLPKCSCLRRGERENQSAVLVLKLKRGGSRTLPVSKQKTLLGEPMPPPRV